MAVLDIDRFCKDLEACAGKNTYGSPEVINIEKLKEGHSRIMCAGLVKAASDAQGVSLYNGSNTIWREYLQASGWIRDGKPGEAYPHRVNGLLSSQLKKGMLVFKWQSTGCSKKKHEADGLGNYCHVGVVTSVSPLRITHASSETGNVTTNTKIGRFCAWGWPKGWPDLNGGELPSEPEEPIEKKEEPTMEDANGRLKTQTTMNLRSGPGTGFKIVAVVKKGTELDYVGSFSSGWVRVEQNGQEGYICTQNEKKKYCVNMWTYEADPQDGTTEEDETEDPADETYVDAPAAVLMNEDDLRATVQELCEGSVTAARQLTAICRILRNAGYDISSVPGMRLPEDLGIEVDE